MPESPERTALYRLYGTDDRLLYIGITSQPGPRFTQHAADKPWWPQVVRREIKWFDTRPLAAEAEVSAIIDESPVHNGNNALDRFGLYRQIADALREAIYSGEIPAGDRLPSENALVARFATTRTTVRKGVALLRAEGLIVSQQGKGAFVRGPVSRSIPIPVADPGAAAEALAAHMHREALVALTQALVAEIAKPSLEPQ
ncbi:GntR family transcriptional regulator [Streptomyces sp. ME19-01-6]|uniref:GntR family transcriptional regulator n=1 Tax=Streptomyces sp. ME19-01-6 TaxID=3028686 RepID=UPI0029AC274E|nr:GntR family transcriptional regulator [Streptomyces sp. ME19-01-6]MDX3230582.1 GntR family transcriptional regulator [Streptomyces sp. ME19-01-6]